MVYYLFIKLKILGLLKESKCLDKDLDEFVYILPPEKNSISFSVYMNTDDIEEAYNN